MSPVSDRALGVDAAAVVVISTGILAASGSLPFMTALVPAVLAIRILLWRRLASSDRGWNTRVELAVLGVCVAAGATNDWLSVVGHGVYRYEVPVYFPELSTIPLWMLLYWGLVLRFVLTLVRWQRLGPPARPRDAVRLGWWRLSSGRLKVAIELALVIATRQAIYRFHGDPWLSWLPLAAALVAYLLLFGADRRDQRIMAAFAAGGPIVEALYIEVGGLHRYELGWLFGVPVWIVLWWVLAVVVWKDLWSRLDLSARRPPRPASLPTDASTDG